MLTELRVRDFAIIDSLDLEFAPGLNVLTGETGSRDVFLCGTDQGYLGIVGALLSGVIIANRHALRN